MFIQIMKLVLKKFVQEDSELFNGKTIKEECINHRIALYIQEVVLEFNGVDTEIRNLKSQIKSGDVKIDVEYDKARDQEKLISNVPSRPDILIHKRGNNSNNYAFIELKKGYKNKGDKRKCQGAKNLPYNYKYALILDNISRPLSKMRIIEVTPIGDELINRIP